MGSRCEARNAGIQHAAAAIAKNTATFDRKVAGSVGFTATSITRVSPAAATIPRPIPAALKARPCPTMSLKILSGSAPSAILTPISAVRAIAARICGAYCPGSPGTKRRARKNRLADHVGMPAETLLPIFVAQDHHRRQRSDARLVRIGIGIRRRLRLRIAVAEIAPGDDLASHPSTEIRGHLRDANLLRRSILPPQR